MKQLPKMPDDKPTLIIQITATLDCDFDRYQNGSLRMTLEGCDVSQGNKHVGSVSPCIPAGVAVKIGSRQWFIHPMALWNAIEEAEKAQYLNNGNKKHNKK